VDEKWISGLVNELNLKLKIRNILENNKLDHDNWITIYVFIYYKYKRIIYIYI